MRKKSYTYKKSHNKVYEDRIPINTFNKTKKTDLNTSGRIGIGGSVRRYPKKVSLIKTFCLVRGSKSGVQQLSKQLSTIFSENNLLKGWCGFIFKFENFSNSITIAGDNVDLSQYDKAILYYHYEPVSSNTLKGFQGGPILYAKARLNPTKMIAEYIEKYMSYSQYICDNIHSDSPAYKMLNKIRWDKVDSYKNLNDSIEDFVSSISRVHLRTDIKNRDDISKINKFLYKMRKETSYDIKVLKPLLYLNVSRKLKNIRPSDDDMVQVQTTYQKTDNKNINVNIDNAFRSRLGSKKIHTRPDAQWRLVLVNSNKLTDRNAKIIDIMTGDAISNADNAYLSIPAKEAFWYGYGIKIVDFLRQSDIQSDIERMANNFIISVRSFLNAILNDYENGNEYPIDNTYLMKCIKPFADLVGNPDAIEALKQSMLEPKNINSSKDASSSVNFGNATPTFNPYTNK